MRDKILSCHNGCRSIWTLAKHESNIFNYSSFTTLIADDGSVVTSPKRKRSFSLRYSLRILLKFHQQLIKFSIYFFVFLVFGDLTVKQLLVMLSEFWLNGILSSFIQNWNIWQGIGFYRVSFLFSSQKAWCEHSKCSPRYWYYNWVSILSKQQTPCKMFYSGWLLNFYYRTNYLCRPFLGTISLFEKNSDLPFLSDLSKLLICIHWRN